MSKKLHAKDLRRDEVAEVVTHAAENTFEFSQKHRHGLLVGTIAVVAVAVIGVIVAWRLDTSRQAAFNDYGTAMKAWEKAELDTVPEGETRPTWDEVAGGLGEVAGDHPGTVAGQIAALQQGLALSRAGKPKEAADVLEAFVSSNGSHWAAPSALAALAANREDAGDAKAAEDALVKLRDGKWRSWPDGAAQALLARMHERQGRSAEARAIYETLSKDEKLASTAWGSEAKTRLEEMGGSTPEG